MVSCPNLYCTHHGHVFDVLRAVADGEHAVVEPDGGAVLAAEDSVLVEHELAVAGVDRHGDRTYLGDG